MSLTPHIVNGGASQDQTTGWKSVDLRSHAQQRLVSHQHLEKSLEEAGLRPKVLGSGAATVNRIPASSFETVLKIPQSKDDCPSYFHSDIYIYIPPPSGQHRSHLPPCLAA